MSLRLPLLISFLLAAAAVGQTPSTDRIEVSNFSPGRTATLTAYGKELKDVVHLWTPFGTIPYTPPEKPNPAVAVFTGPVNAEATPGVYETRVITKGGISTRRFLVLDDLPSVAPADAAESAPSKTVFKGPGCLNGYVNALKPKYYSIELKKDQAVSVEVYARRLDSALDPIIQLSTADGRELGFADDTPGLAGDCQLRVVAPADGTYTLKLRDVQYSGGGAHYFHLRVGGFPLVQAAYPRRTSNGAIQLLSDSSDAISASAKTAPGHLIVPVSHRVEGGSGLALSSAAATAPLLEAEPNDSREQATAISTGTTSIAGRFQTPADIDWFRITAEAPAHLCVTTHSRDVGSPADIVLELWDAAGKKLQESDDAGANDAQLSIALPAAGDYFIGVRELSSQSGAAWTYDLDVEHGRIEAGTATDTVSIPKGGTVTVPVAVKRLGVSDVVTIAVSDLPTGITSTPVIVPPNQKTAQVSLVSGVNAPDSWNHRIRLTATSSRGTQPVLYTPPPPKAPTNTLTRIQTGVFCRGTTAAAYSLAAAGYNLAVNKGGEVKVKVTATRTGDWTQPIEISSAVAAEELPTGVTVAAAKIEQNEIEVTITANDKAVPGTYTLSLQGTLKKDKTTIVQPVPTITLTVNAP